MLIAKSWEDRGPLPPPRRGSGKYEIKGVRYNYLSRAGTHLAWISSDARVPFPRRKVAARRPIVRRDVHNVALARVTSVVRALPYESRVRSRRGNATARTLGACGGARDAPTAHTTAAPSAPIDAARNHPRDPFRIPRRGAKSPRSLHRPSSSFAIVPHSSFFLSPSLPPTHAMRVPRDARLPREFLSAELRTRELRPWHRGLSSGTLPDRDLSARFASLRKRQALLNFRVKGTSFDENSSYFPRFISCFIF